jgi:hypothetical protein
MALNICVEALLRLFFEIINFVFGDVTLIFRGQTDAIWNVLQELLKTISWVFIFYLIRYLVKTRVLSYILIIGLPLLLHAIAGVMAGIPLIGWIFSGTILVTAGLLSAIAWGFIAITDETVPVYLRFIGLPGMMLLGFASGLLGPLGWVMAAGAVAALSTAARIVVPLSTLLVLLLTLWSPTWFCETLNTGLKGLANIRQEGLVEGIRETIIAVPILIKKRVAKFDKGG